MPIQQERRDSERVPCMQSCTYELSRLSGSDVVELSEGHAFTIDMSGRGMLLFLPQAVSERQVFEIRAPSVAVDESTTKLVEVCWTRPLPVSAHTTMHLAGVRFLFEPPTSIRSQPGN